MTHNIYNFSIHWKQGDDLAYFLENSDGDAKKALKDWKNSLENGAKKIESLLNNFKRRDLVIEQADGHYIALSGDEKGLEKSVEEGLLDKEELDEEEFGEDEIEVEDSEYTKDDEYEDDTLDTEEFEEDSEEELLTEEELDNLGNNVVETKLSKKRKK